MVLRTGDQGDDVKSLQRALNRMGAMLLVDGNFGGATCDAVAIARQELSLPGPPEADETLQQAIAAVPDPCPALTAAGMTFIARQEVSDATMYQRQFQTPTCPPPPSGVTIGIGYDCRFVGRREFQADWAAVLPAVAVTQLEAVLGKPGTPDLLAPLSTVVVPLSAAMRVFATSTLPKYLAQTRSIYPQIDDAAMTPARRTALVSLVYNRGTDLRGDRRREMRTIRTLLAAARCDAIAEQFESMTRLWDPRKEGGLIERRRAEATLWRSGFGALQLD